MMDMGYRVKHMRNYVRTTIPAYYKYPNLIEGMVLWKKNQLWQTDITYYRVGEQYYYIVFIMDVYTRQIIGYQASNHMRASANMLALKMALKGCGSKPLHTVHHSDRGSQYIDKQYTKMLKDSGIYVSMGSKAQENAYAERINGIIKNEYLRYKHIVNFDQLKKELKKAVNHYNNKRLHRAFEMIDSPNSFEQKVLNLCSQKRPTVTVYTEGNPKIKWVSNPLDFLPEKTQAVQICPMDYKIETFIN